MSGVGDVIGIYLLLVFVELMLAVMVVLAFLSPSEKVSLEKGRKVGWEKLGGFYCCQYES